MNLEHFYPDSLLCKTLHSFPSSEVLNLHRTHSFFSAYWLGLLYNPWCHFCRWLHLEKKANCGFELYVHTCTMYRGGPKWKGSVKIHPWINCITLDGLCAFISLRDVTVFLTMHYGGNPGLQILKASYNGTQDPNLEPFYWQPVTHRDVSLICSVLYPSGGFHSFLKNTSMNQTGRIRPNWSCAHPWGRRRKWKEAKDAAPKTNCWHIMQRKEGYKMRRRT